MTARTADRTPLDCDECGKTLAGPAALKGHKLFVHTPQHCDECDRDFPNKGTFGHHNKAHHSDGGPLSRGRAREIEDASPFAETAPAEVLDTERAGWRERLWGGTGSAHDKVKSSERKPRKRRVSTEGVWSTAWTAAGAALCSTGADIPVGNCLQFQAPIIGGILDEAIAGTFVDILIQPIAGQGKRLKAVSSVLAMPILVGALERNPGAAPILEPLLRQVIREHLVAMTPVIKARQKADESYRKALGELGMEAGEDPVEAVLDAIFPKDGTPSGNGVGRATVDA